LPSQTFVFTIVKRTIFDILVNMRLILFLIIILSSFKIIGQSFNREKVLNVVEILSADSLEGREIGTAGSKLAQNIIVSWFKEHKLAAFNTLPDYRQDFKFRGSNGTNLLGYLKGKKDPDKYLVITAHYDHEGIKNGKIYNGADDNASGCALVYGLGKMLTQLETRRKNIILVFLDEEETGHAGSLAFANWVKAQEFDVHSVHTADEVGWDQDQDRNIELELPTPYLTSLYRKHAKPFDIKLYKTKTTGSDHREFREAGFQTVGITEEYKNGDGNPHHHMPSDTFEKVDYQFLAFTTYLVFKVVEGVLSE